MNAWGLNWFTTETMLGVVRSSDSSYDSVLNITITSGSKKSFIHQISLLSAPLRVPLLGAGVLGDGLGALGHGVLAELPGQHQVHGGLDLPGGDCGP